MLTASTLLITSAFTQTQSEIDSAQTTIEITAWDAACRGVTSGTPHGSYYTSNALDKDYMTKFYTSDVTNQFL